MEKQPNQLLWHGIFLLLVLAAIFGIYKAVQAVDYTWRWNAFPSTSPIRQNRNTMPSLTAPWSRTRGQGSSARRSRSQPPSAIAISGGQVAEGDTVFLAAIPSMCN
jgi:polar amino acid transport system permease protein